MPPSLVYTVVSSYSFLAASSIVVSFLLVQLAPQYTVFRSYSWTASVIFAAQWASWTFYLALLYPRFFSPLRHVPGPTEGNSFINGQWAAITKEPSGIPQRRWTNTVPNNGLIRYLHLMNRERLLVVSPKALAEVLTTKSYDFVKPELLRKGVGQLLGYGILFAEGDEHKVQRKNLMPAFSFRHVKELYPIFWAKSQEMVRCIEDELKKNYPSVVQEVGEWGSRATLDIIGTAGLGQDFNSLADPNTDLNVTYRRIFQPSPSAQRFALLQFFIPHIILRNLPFKRNEDIMAASRVARMTSRDLIALKRQRMANKEVLQPDIISVALESGGFTDDELINNMMTFLAAGHETTASAFQWATYLMCQKPEVQTRLRQEVRAHISHLDDTMDHVKLDGIAYLKAVCNEVLRVYSPVPLTLRVAAVDTSILGQFVPEGTTIIMSPWATNLSTELWGPDAAEFNPDRWMAPGQANSGGAESNYAFMTFLHGPRSCIGSRFAVAELGCLLAAFVGKFEFEQTFPDEKIEIKGGITARPRNGMRVNLKVLDDW